MREILFRGQNGLGNWFYGGYVYCKHSETHNIVTENTSRSFDWFDVIHETIGQYTGLKDKNGVKIFEGDKLLVSYEYEEIVLPMEEGFFSTDSDSPLCDIYQESQVIGNIHCSSE